MEKKIIFSIVVPVFNAAEYLEECFESIFNQSFNLYEVIAIDDGSTDDSLSILKNIQKKHNNLKIISESNSGPGAARNLGIKHSRGNYIYFLDSDDIIDKDTLKICYDYLTKNNCDFVGFQADIFGDIEGKDLYQYRYVDRFIHNERIFDGFDFIKKFSKKIPILNIPLVVFRKEFLSENNIFFLENVIHEDVGFYFELMSKNPKFILSDRVLYHRRYRKNSVMTYGVDKYRIDSKLIVYTSIDNIVCPSVIREYEYQALKGIRQTLQMAFQNKIEIEYGMKFILKDLILKKNIKLMNLCCVFELYMCYYYLIKYNVFSVENDTLKKYIYTKIYSSSVLSKLYESRYKIGLYGIGDFAKIFVKVCKEICGDYIAKVEFIDTYKKKYDCFYDDIPVKNLNDILLNEFDAVIIITEAFEDEIYEILSTSMDKNKIYKISNI